MSFSLPPLSLLFSTFHGLISCLWNIRPPQAAQHSLRSAYTAHTHKYKITTQQHYTIGNPQSFVEHRDLWRAGYVIREASEIEIGQEEPAKSSTVVVDHYTQQYCTVHTLSVFLLTRVWGLNPSHCQRATTLLQRCFFFLCCRYVIVSYSH